MEDLATQLDVGVHDSWHRHLTVCFDLSIDLSLSYCGRCSENV